MTITLFAAIACAVAAAGFAQGATGIGFAMITAPIIGYLRPDAMPGLVLMLMIPLNGYVVWRNWGAIDRASAGWVTSGRLMGTFGGLAVLALLPVTALNQLIGASILLAVLASVAAPNFAPGNKAFIAAGLVTGVTETATGVGGPPLALVYQHHQPHVLRPTIAICFLVGELLSLGFLAAAGHLSLGQFYFAVLLLPAIALGIGASRLAHSFIDARTLRFIVLAFALVSGILLLLP
ncbi:MAG: TSUP family transporter [Rhizobiaceae bacterium]|jgi:uncharacterized membrane protein YfcA